MHGDMKQANRQTARPGDIDDGDVLRRQRQRASRRRILKRKSLMRWQLLRAQTYQQACTGGENVLNWCLQLQVACTTHSWFSA